MKPTLVTKLNAAVSDLSGTGCEVDMTFRNMAPDEFKAVKDYYEKSGAIEDDWGSMFSVTLRPISDAKTSLSVDFVRTPNRDIANDILENIAEINKDYARRNGIEMKQPGDDIDAVIHQNEKP